MYTSPLQSLNSPTQTASTPPTTSTSTNPAVDLTNTFLQLLTMQLKNQSPLNPLDPNAFVTQLAQFDSLGELAQIQQLMQTLVNNVSPKPVSTPGASANPSANLTSGPSLNTVAH